MRVVLLRLGEAEHLVVWSHHHLLLDGWSRPLVLGEGWERYRARRGGGQPGLKVERQDLGQAEAYWRRELKGLERPTLLAGLVGGGEGDREGSYRKEERVLSEAATAGLEKLAREQRLTMSTLVQGAGALLLSRYSGEREVVFGATVSGRPGELAGVEEMVGMFINTLPVRVRVEGGRELMGWLEGLQEGHVEQRRDAT